MWKGVRSAAMAITVIVVWFTVIALGFGSQLWPVLAGLR
jgi:hypothetical protein